MSCQTEASFYPATFVENDAVFQQLSCITLPSTTSYDNVEHYTSMIRSYVCQTINLNYVTTELKLRRVNYPLRSVPRIKLYRLFLQTLLRTCFIKQIPVSY